MIRRPATILLVTASTIAAFVAIPTALAGKGGGGGKPGGSTDAILELVVMDGASQAAHHGRVTFNVSTTATSRPYVGLRCWQGANWVYDGYVGYFPEYLFPENWFVLDSPYWADSVEASCTARLFYHNRRGGENVLKTLTFAVVS